MSDQEHFDTEITLGVGRLLVLFFGLVVLCGIFMGIGYSLGRSATKATADATTTPAAAPEKTASAPAIVVKQQEPTQDLSFYKSVEQKESDPKLTPPEPQPKTAEKTEKETKPPVAPQPEIKAGAVPGSGYMVQIAAVSKKDDADALVDALRRKQYPVFVTSVPGDKLFHVQIGPFADTKDAEAMRSRLLADGYNPILKR